MIRSRIYLTLAVSLAAALATSSAQATSPDNANSRLAPAIGNTIVSTHPDGRQARLWLDGNGTYAAESRAGSRSGGTWTLKGDKLCLRQHQPISIPFPYCKSVPAEQVGKPWRDTAVTGEPVTNEIVRGKSFPQASARHARNS